MQRFGWRMLGQETTKMDIFFPETFGTYLQLLVVIYSGADKSLARPGRKRATATEDFEFHISYL
jgi:hypothetical protein